MVMRLCVLVLSFNIPAGEEHCSSGTESAKGR